MNKILSESTRLALRQFLSTEEGQDFLNFLRLNTPKSILSGTNPIEVAALTGQIATGWQFCTQFVEDISDFKYWEERKNGKGKPEPSSLDDLVAQEMSKRAKR